MCKSRSSDRAFALGLCAALAASAVQAGTVETRTAFGRIEMVEEVRTRDPGELPIMHVATEWTKLHLRWRSADGVMAVDVVDDGWIIEASASGAGCSAGSTHLQYSGVAGEGEIKPVVRTLLASLDKACPRLAKGVAYAPTLAEGAADFSAAEDGLRARALILFKRPPTRCLTPLPASGVMIFADPFQGPRCR